MTDRDFQNPKPPTTGPIGTAGDSGAQQLDANDLFRQIADTRPAQGWEQP